jgi:hypothetical protein
MNSRRRDEDDILFSSKARVVIGCGWWTDLGLWASGDHRVYYNDLDIRISAMDNLDGCIRNWEHILGDFPQLSGGVQTRIFTRRPSRWCQSGTLLT